MVLLNSFIFAFAMYTLTASQKASGVIDPCGVTGNWTNQFGSTMDITCQAGIPIDSGNINGVYVYTPNTLVPLFGRYTMSGRDCILGFSVVLESATGASNTTSWTGIHYANEDNIIHTHWILAKHTEKADMWKNTHLGNAVFTRTDKLGHGGEVVG